MSTSKTIAVIIFEVALIAVVSNVANLGSSDTWLLNIIISLLVIDRKYTSVIYLTS